MKAKHECIQEVPITQLQVDMTYIKQKIDNIETKIDKFIDKVDEKYATKDELNNDTQRINKLESYFGKLVWVIVTAIIIAVLKLVLIQ